MRAISGREHGPEVRDDGQRLERRLRQPALDRPLEQPRTGRSGLARRAERVAAGHLLEHDAAPTLAIALAQQPERGLDPLGVVVRRLGQLRHRERLRRDDEQRLDRARERIDRDWTRSGGAGGRPPEHPFVVGAGDPDGGEGRRLGEGDLVRLAQLEQGEEGDRLLDAREPVDLGVEVEAAPASQHGAEALEELGHGREAERHVREGHLRRLDRQPSQRGDEAAGSWAASRRSSCGASGAGPTRK